MKAVIIGWFGKKNLGDDLLESISKEIILTNSSVTTLTRLTIDELAKDKTNSEAIISDSDIVFMGPGGLINRGIEYIIEPLKKSKKLFLIGISIEDYTGLCDKVIQFLAEKACVSLFRDNDSFDYFSKFSPIGDVGVISDIYLSANALSFPDEVIFNSERTWVALPRKWNKDFFQNRYAEFLSNKLSSWWLNAYMQDTNIIKMCKSSDGICVIDQSDKDLFYNISHSVGSNFLGLFSNENELRDNIVGRNLISSRYHGTLIALKNGVYTESFCYQNKLRTLCSRYSLPIYGETNDKSIITLSKIKDDGVASMCDIKSKLSYL